jgi:hypothetical protein
MFLASWTAEEQDRQLFHKAELFTVFCTAMNFGERFGWSSKRSTQSAKITRWEKARVSGGLPTRQHKSLRLGLPGRAEG